MTENLLPQEVKKCETIQLIISRPTFVLFLITDFDVLAFSYA